MSADGRERDGWAGAGTALASMAFAAYVGSTFARDGVSPTAAGVAYVLLLVVSIVAHELAHAAVGRAVGATVTGMRLGFGPRLTPPGSWLDLRPVIVAAHVSYIPPRGVRRWQEFAVGVAGIALHALVIVVILVAAPDPHPVWVGELLFANVVALVSNAIPLRGGVTTTSAGANDGLQLLRLLRRGPYVSGADPDLGDVVRAYDAGGVVAAQDALAGLRRPDIAYLRLLLAQAVLGARRYRDAAALAVGAADPRRPWAADHLRAEAGAMELATSGRTELATSGRTELATSGRTELATSGHADPARVAEVDRLAESAMAAVPPSAPGPERAAVAHTLALTRVLAGRWAEAEEMCAWAVGGTTTAVDRAAVLATQGWAALGAGDRPRAEALLHEALRLDQAGPLVQAAAARLSQAPTAS